jgi:hypothetical protein
MPPRVAYGSSSAYLAHPISRRNSAGLSIADNKKPVVMTGFLLIWWSYAGSNRGPLACHALRNRAAEGVLGHDPRLTAVSIIAPVIYPVETQSVRRLLPRLAAPE